LNSRQFPTSLSECIEFKNEMF